MLRKRIAQHRLAAFVLLAFGWTWTWDALYYVFDWWNAFPVSFPRQWGLPIAAVVVVRASDVSLRTWLGRTLDRRVRPGLYLVALFVPLLVSNVQPIFRGLGGGSLTVSPPGTPLSIVLFLLANMFLLGGVEEIGWRGFLQPRLQEHTSVLTAGLGIGVLWWAWHLPLFFAGNPNYALELWPFVSYTTFVIGASAVFGAFVNVTEGRVLPLMLMHASINLGAFLEASGGVLDGSPLTTLLVGSGFWWLIVVVLVLAYGKRMVPGSEVEPLT